MSPEPRRQNLPVQLQEMLLTAGARPVRWVAGTVAASLALALLDTLGVAAMIPLTQLLTGSTDSPAVEWLSNVIGTDDIGSLIPVVAGFIVTVFIVKSVCSIIFRWWLLGRTTRISALSAAELARRYSLAPYSEHRTRGLSAIYRNVTEATGQAASVLLAVVSMISDILMLVAVTVVLAVTSPLVTGIAVALFGFLVFGVQLLLRRTQYRLGEELAEARLEAWKFLLPSLDGFREARLTSSAKVFNDGYRRARLHQARIGRTMGVLGDLPRYLLEVGFVVAILGISVVLFSTSTSTEALTVLGVFSAASLRAIPALNRVAANLATIRTGRAGLDIFTGALAELEAGGAHDELPKQEGRFSGVIELDRVSFRFPDAERDVVQSITLRIPENQTIAFVGSSGAGKSTLLDLMLGLLEPTSGSIKVGGRPISDDLAAWYAQLGVVPQDVFLLNDTLLANIVFGFDADDIDHARVDRVVAAAQLGQLVNELPRGLATPVGERGTLLSGGQRQRIGIARALYRRPSVLVLDEATSALDNATEHEITKTLGELRGTMTVVIVAHRLSTVRHADTLVFLKDGRVEAEGSFESVRAENADFARLVDLGELA